MKTELYDAIFKRKSFHLFRNTGKAALTEEEIKAIEKSWAEFDPLYPDIQTAIRIADASKVNFKRDAEYCILIYSENKDNSLMNIGYLGEQLDLWLVSHNIGSLWFGIGKPDLEQYQGLDYVIMLAIHKIDDETLFRKDMFKSKRKPLEETWSGEPLPAAEIARFAPSACNSQPWFIQHENDTLKVYRYKKPGKRGIMPAASVPFYNRIDLGIYLCILELCLLKDGISFERALYVDDGQERELTLSAQYELKH